MSEGRPQSVEIMTALDSLPAPIRRAIVWCPFRINPAQIAATLAFLGYAQTRKMIENSGPRNVQAADKEWRQTTGRSSPHVAAGATLMETKPLDPAVVRRVKRRQGWMIR